MSKCTDKIREEILRLLDCSAISRSELRELLELVESDCTCRLDCMREEDGGES